MIEGVSHITFIVGDLRRMTDFLTGIFDAREVYASGERTFSVAKEKFFLIGGVWIATMEGNALPEKTYNHVAFKIAEAEFERYAERVRRHGVEIREGRSRVAGEGSS